MHIRNPIQHVGYKVKYWFLWLILYFSIDSFLTLKVRFRLQMFAGELFFLCNLKEGGTNRRGLQGVQRGKACLLWERTGITVKKIIWKEYFISQKHLAQWLYFTLLKQSRQWNLSNNIFAEGQLWQTFVQNSSQ